MFLRVSRCLRQAVKKAPLANGPLQCPAHMDGLYHKNNVIWLQQFGNTLIAVLTGIAFLRYQHINRKGDYFKYLDQNEVKEAMKEWGCFPGHVPEWQKANVAKARAALEGGDDEDEDDE